MDEGIGKEKGQATPREALEREKEQKQGETEGSQGPSRQASSTSSVWKHADFSPDEGESERK